MNFKSFTKKFTKKIIKSNKEIISTLESIESFKNEPSLLNLTKFGINILTTINSFKTEINEISYLLNNNYKLLPVDPAVVKLLHENCKLHGNLVQSINQENIKNNNSLIEFDNKFIIFNEHYNYNLYGKNNANWLDYFSKLYCRNNNKLLTSLKIENYNVKIHNFSLLESNIQMNDVVNYNLYLSKFLNKGLNRSLLFNSEPGTGKTTICKEIANSFNFNTLIIDPSINLEDLSMKALIDFCKIAKIECILLDDIDKLESEEALLTILDNLRPHLKLVLGTSNEKDLMSSHLIRPGRFDEVIEFKAIDENIIKNLLKNESKENFELMKNFPVAFIKEYLTRKIVLGEVEALNSIKDLLERINKNNLNKSIKHKKIDKNCLMDERDED